MADHFATLSATASLPVVRNGYDQSATKAVINEIQARLAAALDERNEARARVAELEQQVIEADTRKQAVADALVLASRYRTESERETMEIQSESRRRADEIVQAAETEAERILEAARTRSGDLENELRTAGVLAEQTLSQLAAFLQSLRRLDANGANGDGWGSPADQPAAAFAD
jgi:cell division septum initiation protein DivIVA